MKSSPSYTARTSKSFRIAFGFAVQMIAFGVLGEYVGRLYQEVKGRPIYLVREKIGFDR